MGTLYLCATPIGNLEDITLRVLRTLKEVDLIAAEDTRQTIKLLNHFDIKTPLTSYHEHNKYQKTGVLVNELLAGKNIAVVTDAGTPAISDPGAELALAAYEAGIPVTSLPGASAVITALTLGGLPTRQFAFEGFLPMDKKERARALERLKNTTYTTVFYEAPHRLTKTLQAIAEVLPGTRKIAVCKELTKRHEKVMQCTLEEACTYYEKNDPMQAYMIDMSENKSIEETEHVPDRAVIDFRRTVRGKKKETTESEKSEKAKKHFARNRWLAGACCAAAMLAVGLPYLRQYQNVEEVVQTEGQSVAVTSEAQKAAEEPLLSPMATEEPEESLAPVPTQDTTQESLNPQANGETSEEVSISPTQESMQQEEKKEEQQATADIKTITYTIQRGDTLTSICQKQYGTISRINEICQLNGISPEDIIYAGGKLLLPES